MFTVVNWLLTYYMLLFALMSVNIVSLLYRLCCRTRPAADCHDKKAGTIFEDQSVMS